jgi:deoxyribose-phosphate aldolase
MFIDFAIIDTDIIDKEAKNQLSEAIGFGANSITVPHYLVKSAKNAIKKSNVCLSCFVDFPLGISDQKTRVYAVEQAIAAGVNTIDITMPQNLAANRKYDRIRDDILSIKDVCVSQKINIRYILEYRIFDHKCLKKICEIFDDNQISFSFPSTGFFLDNLADNIIASSFLHQNSKEINVISTGNLWTENHFSILNKSGVYGFRTFSIHVLKKYRKFLSDNT